MVKQQKINCFSPLSPLIYVQTLNVGSAALRPINSKLPKPQLPIRKLEERTSDFFVRNVHNNYRGSGGGLHGAKRRRPAGQPARPSPEKMVLSPLY